MALIVEDGTGVANADSLMSLADARALAADYGITLPVDDTEAEVKLRQGYLGLAVVEKSLQGTRTHDIQTGIYPRTGVLSNCVAVDAESIPRDVKFAQLYQSEALSSGLSVNAINNGLRLAGFNVQGVYSEDYQDGSSEKVNATVQGVYNSLYPLTIVGYKNSPCGRENGAGGLYRYDMGYL